MSDQHWRDNAACKYSDPEIFFPRNTNPGSPAVAEAGRVCNGDGTSLHPPCPVRQECFNIAVSTDTYRLTGVFGGRLFAKDGTVQQIEVGQRRHLTPQATLVRRRIAENGGVKRPPERRDDCGSSDGYYHHYRQGENPCDGCRAAYRVRCAERRARQRQQREAGAA